VLAARLLGRTSWVHLALAGAGEAGGPHEGEAGHLHFHARAPGRFLPPESEVLGVRLDPAQAFVFPDPGPK
jgi:iron(III) transport system ATP-binding protein